MDKEKLEAQLGRLTIVISKLHTVLHQKQEEANKIATEIETMKEPKNNGE